MPTASLPELVELTDTARTGKGLLTRALPLPSDWELGIRFRSTGCVPPVTAGRCIIDDPGLPERVGDGVVFEPVYIRQSATCSTLSRVGAVDRAGERLIGTTEWGLGRLLVEGFADLPNPTLNDATIVTNAANVVDALSCLEQAIADTGYGGRAVIHAPYRAMAYLSDHYLGEQDRTAAGHQIITSPGYPAEATTVTLWATGPVWAAVGPVERFGSAQGAANWRVNDDDAWSQRLAMAAFDPCLNLAATFTVPACTGGS